MDKEFWKAALIRAVRTFAESALAYIGTGALVIKDVNWLAALSAGAFGFITAILWALKGLPETNARIEYRYMDENGIPVDGHYALVKNVEKDICDGETCDLSKYLDGDSNES